jgi:hypothetical protein
MLRECRIDVRSECEDDASAARSTGQRKTDDTYVIRGFSSGNTGMTAFELGRTRKSLNGPDTVMPRFRCPPSSYLKMSGFKVGLLRLFPRFERYAVSKVGA